MESSEAKSPKAVAAAVAAGGGAPTPPAPGAVLAASARRGPRWRVGIGAAVVLVLVAVAVAVVAGLAAPAASVTEIGPSAPAVALTAAPSPVPTGIVVHVVGAVAHPGVYALPSGSRAIDAVAAAGGFAHGADKSAQNLARRLADGEQLNVPTKGESAAIGAVGDAPGGGSGGVPGATNDGSGGLVDLNTASETELETLPRVGPAMAQKIIAWRQANGGFASVDDLQNVSGIGPKTFESLKALVTV